jgi:hypothetical protein
MTYGQKIRRQYTDNLKIKEKKTHDIIYLILFLIMGFLAVSSLILAF